MFVLIFIFSLTFEGNLTRLNQYSHLNIIFHILFNDFRQVFNPVERDKIKLLIFSVNYSKRPYLG